MKNIFFLACCFAFVNASAQLTPKNNCPVFTVDILDGTINGLDAIATIGQIKGILPCFTSTEPDGSITNCGGGVFYKDKDLYFFTDRDYIEIGEKFKGKLSLPLMGAARTGLFKWLGLPQLKDTDWDAYQMAYGTLVVHYNKLNKVIKLQITKKTTATLNLCE